MSLSSGAARSDRPQLEQKRKLVKEVLKAVERLDGQSAARFTWNHPRCRGKSGQDVIRAGVTLSDAQHVIARESGFESRNPRCFRLARFATRVARTHAFVRSIPLLFQFKWLGDLFLSLDGMEHRTHRQFGDDNWNTGTFSRFVRRIETRAERRRRDKS